MWRTDLVTMGVPSTGHCGQCAVCVIVGNMYVFALLLVLAVGVGPARIGGQPGRLPGAPGTRGATDPLGATNHTIMVGEAGTVAVSEDCKQASTMATSPESRLLADVRCGYAVDQRPVRDHRTAVSVVVKLILKYITFDEHEETISIHSWLALSWKDEFLTWEPNNYDGLKHVQIQSMKIWQPELSLYNANVDHYGSSSFYSPCLVAHTGVVKCVPHVSHAAVCSTNLRRWPYDTQACKLSFGSWMRTGEEVNFTGAIEPVDTTDYKASADWRLVNVSFYRSSGKYACCPNETYPSLEYKFTMRRLAGGLAAIVVIPSIAIIVVTLCTLLLDTQDSTRLALCCFSLLGHYIFLAQVGYYLPKHSIETPIILLFLRDSMVISAASLVLTLLLTGIRTSTAPPAAWLLKVNSLVHSRTSFVVFNTFEPRLIEDSRENVAEEADKEAAREAVAERTNFCNILNSVSFILMTFVYFILILCYIPWN